MPTEKRQTQNIIVKYFLSIDMALYFDKICECSHLALIRMSKKTILKDSMAETRLQEWKTSKLPFLGHPLCSWLHFCAYFSSSWSCGHQGLGAPLWKLILAAGREIAGRLDLSRGFVGLQHRHPPISSTTPRSTSPWRHADGQHRPLANSSRLSNFSSTSRSSSSFSYFFSSCLSMRSLSAVSILPGLWGAVRIMRELSWHGIAGTF